MLTTATTLYFAFKRTIFQTLTCYASLHKGCGVMQWNIAQIWSQSDQYSSDRVHVPKPTRMHAAITKPVK